MLNLPDSSDFKVFSIRYLVQAIDTLFRSEKGNSEIRNEEATNEEHWKERQDILFNSFTLLFLSIENFIKASVCDVSPYLLISTKPQAWSKGNKASCFENLHLFSLKGVNSI